MNTINTRIEHLRNEMSSQQVDAYIIPSSDAHQSEYVADRYKSRTWISGFTGSAGTALVTGNHAGLWTDGRYFLQAEEELATSEFELHKLVNQGQAEFVGFLIDELSEGQVVACDGSLFSKGQISAFRKALDPKGIVLRTDLDLIESIWKDRPSLPVAPIYEHDLSFAGKTRLDKINDFRKAFQLDGADSAFLTCLDDIAWIYNLRGTDVDCNPVFIAYSVIEADQCILFADKNKFTDDLISQLESEKIYVHPYKDVFSYLNSLSEQVKMHVCLADCSQAAYDAIHATVIPGQNHVRYAKSIKNETEIGHFYEVMKKDAVALVRMYRWLENELATRGVKETEIAEQLAYQRSQLPHYVGESFDAIVGFRGNGAIIHYHAQEATCATIQGDGMLLVDSGGQYLDGTTDITRTTYLGEPSKEEKKAFTMVLKGHIALDSAIFPKGTRGVQLDTLARMFLWNERMNYGHGTGHGVGFFMNVHEPPQGFAPGLSLRGKTIIKPGMVTSNEPGFYKENAFGIRIENLILAKEDESNAFGSFMKHDTLTLFPIELKLIDETIMNSKEKAWLNQYHYRVYDEVSPLLNEEEKKWLQVKCKPLN